MQRQAQLQKLAHVDVWDVIIIGGGASGLGVALDCITRGYTTLLCEAQDFAKGTSSRSTKLLHGGVRYLAQGNFSLVYEALHERAILIKNAPHLCRKQAFIIPNDNILSALYYGFGLKLYEIMAGNFSLGKTLYLHAQTAKERLEGIQPQRLKAGVCYYDGQFDDARLALALAMSAEQEGACMLNYVRATALLKDEAGKIKGVNIQDMLTNTQKTVYSKCVINATGVFTNELNALDGNKSLDVIASQGIHLVFEKKFLPTDAALMIPKTTDGRVLFAIPWHNKLLVGTTDTPINTISYEPKPLQEEIDFILNTFMQYTILKPTKDDILSIFVGLRPLAAFKSKKEATKNVSRTHKISISPSNLVHINGGKWTTYRKMAEETIDKAIECGLLKPALCRTKHYKIFGYREGGDFNDRLCVYGSYAQEIQKLEKQSEKLASLIHKNYPYTYAQVQWSIEQEAAQTLEDVLARRIRLLFLDAQAALDVAQEVGAFMANALKWQQTQLEQEVCNFCALAQQYLN